MQISGICNSGHKIYLNGFSNFSVEWNCCFYCRSSTHHLFSINLSTEEDPPIYRYFGFKQVIWPIFSPFQAILRIFFHQQFYVDTRGRRTHSYFEKIIFLSRWSWGPYQNWWSRMYVFHQQFIHVEVHIEIGGWQWSHPFFIANLKILWSLPAFHQQQPPRLCCGCFYTICPGWTLIELFPLLSLFPFLLYPISYPWTFFSIDQGCTTFDELTKKVTLFPCFLFSSVGSLGRTHIIGLFKSEWCIVEYYFGFQRDFSV